MLQCIFGYHCHRDEWLTEKDLSHVSLPHGTMLQRQNTHYGRRGARESTKQNKGSTVSTERPWPDRSPSTTYGCLSFAVLFGRLKYDSLELMNDALFHPEEPICQCSDKVNNSLWHRTCAWRCVHTGEDVQVRQVTISRSAGDDCIPS